MLTKLFVVAALVVILISLGSALYHLIKSKDQPDRIVKSLTIRITLSIALFIFLLIAFATGLIKPHGLNPNPIQAESTQN